MLRKLFYRLRASLLRGKIERELERELRSHLEMETAENMRRGMSEEEARLAALRSFGGVEQAKEAYRDLSRFRLVEGLWQDVRFSARLLSKQPGFLAVAMLTLALGIGASTAIFTVVNAVLIRSLPYRDPSHLVSIDAPGIEWGDPYSEHSAWGWRDRVKSFEQVAAFGDLEAGTNMTGAGEAERIDGRSVSANFFQTLGVSAVTGRLFGPEQERPENQVVAVISSRLWRRRFKGAPDAIGKTIQLNGRSFTIIGDEVTLDYGVLAFNAALALLTGLIVGLLPAIQGSKVDLIESLKDGMQRLGSGASALSLKSALIAGEIALSLVLLIGAGLLLRSLTKALSIDVGFERENVLSVSMALPVAQYDVISMEQTKVKEFYRRLIEQVSAIPGVKAAGATSKIPLGREGSMGYRYDVEGRPPLPTYSESSAETFFISSDYFKAMGIPLLQGRAFTDADRLQAPPVLIINEMMARRVFPDGNALGKRMKLSADYPQVPREVIGVVGAVRSFGPEEEPRKEIFLPYLQGTTPPSTLAIRTVGDPMAIASAVREAVRRLDENLPPYDIKTLKQRISDSVARRRFLVSLMSLFAIMALALAATGIYGVMTYLVAQRTREIGIRMALGATKGVVLNLIMKQGVILILIGTTIGIAGAIASTRLIKTMLFGVSATDPETFALIALLLVAVALIACYLPARRATKVDPLIALRRE